MAGWNRPTCVPCRQSFLVCLWLCLALVRCLECLRCLKMQMVYSVCTSPFSRPESRLRLHKCNIWAALRASPLVLRRYHASPRSGPDAFALFAGGLDHLSAAAWVSPPCLMRVLRLSSPHAKTRLPARGEDPRISRVQLSVRSSQGRDPSTRRGGCPSAAVFLSPSGYCPRVSLAMDRCSLSNDLGKTCERGMAL